MCGRFELNTNFENLPKILKDDYPYSLELKYEKQSIIRPTDPVIVLKNEGKVKTTFMYWGFISPWAKKPLEKTSLRPFNARSETVSEKKLFKSSWVNKRCLIPSSGFLEKGFRIRKKKHQPFWLGGIWSRWHSPEGTEIDSCCILTTQSNYLLRSLNSRMPVIVPQEMENEWMKPIKNSEELNLLSPLLKGWSPENWIVEELNNKNETQMNLF